MRDDIKREAFGRRNEASKSVKRFASLASACALALTLLGAAPPPGSSCAPASAFVGTICAPDAPGRYPAVLILGGSRGGDGLARVAARLAGSGYVAASVAYFGLPSLPRTLDQIPVESVGSALNAVAQRADVDGERVALFGDSKGGELALLAATVYPRFRAVVAMVPSPFAWQARGGGSSWTIDGKPVPFVPNERPLRGPMLTSREMFDASLLRHRGAVDEAMFPLEKIRGPVLCLAADDDRVWNSPYQCSLAMAYLRAHAHAYSDEAVEYARAGHAFLFATPERPLLDAGGSARGNVESAARAWSKIDEFLRSALR